MRPCLPLQGTVLIKQPLVWNVSIKNRLFIIYTLFVVHIPKKELIPEYLVLRRFAYAPVLIISGAWVPLRTIRGDQLLLFFTP